MHESWELVVNKAVDVPVEAVRSDASE